MTDAQQALAQVREALEAENERLTAALRHEADCVEAAKAEIERLQIGIELFDAADAYLRTKLDAANDLAEMIASERDELRRQLAEAELDARRYRWIAGHCRSTSEHWGGRWSIVVEGPCPAKHDEEDAFDAAIDAAMDLTRPAEES